MVIEDDYLYPFIVKLLALFYIITSCIGDNYPLFFGQILWYYVKNKKKEVRIC